MKAGGLRYVFNESIYTHLPIVNILYGLIAANGVKVLIKDKTDLSDIKNLVIVSTMLVIGLGGASIALGSITLSGMSLAAIFGILINAVLNFLTKNEKA